MCMGTALMSNIRHIRYAAHDPYCGMVHLARSEPYYMSKQLDIRHEGGEAEQFQLTIQCITELRSAKSDAVYRQFREYAPKAADRARNAFFQILCDKSCLRTDKTVVLQLIFILFYSKWSFSPS